MNKEDLKKEVSAKVENLSKEQVQDLVFFLILSYSVFTSLLKNIGGITNYHAEAFEKIVKDDGTTAVDLIEELFKVEKVEIEKE